MPGLQHLVTSNCTQTRGGPETFQLQALPPQSKLGRRGLCGLSRHVCP